MSVMVACPPVADGWVSGVFENWKVVIWSWKMSEARLACHGVVLSSSAGERLLEQKDGISQTLQLLS